MAKRFIIYSLFNERKGMEDINLISINGWQSWFPEPFTVISDFVSTFPFQVDCVWITPLGKLSPIDKALGEYYLAVANHT